MARKTYTKGLAFYQEDENILAEICKETGLNASEVVRYLIRKCKDDPVEKQIIIQNFLNAEGRTIERNRLVRIMSDKKAIQKASTQRPANDTGKSVSSTGLSYFNSEVANFLDLWEKYGLYPAQRMTFERLRRHKVEEKTINCIIKTAMEKAQSLKTRETLHL